MYPKESANKPDRCFFYVFSHQKSWRKLLATPSGTTCVGSEVELADWPATRRRRATWAVTVLITCGIKSEVTLMAVWLKFVSLAELLPSMLNTSLL